MMNKRLGEIIRKSREEKNITSSELAKMIGISQATVSNIENGKFGKRKSTITNLKTIIKGLDIDIEDDEINTFLNSEKSVLEEFTLNTSLDLLNNKPEVFVDEDSQISIDELREIKDELDKLLEILVLTRKPQAKRTLLQVKGLLEKSQKDIADDFSKMVLNDVDVLKTMMQIFDDKKKGE
ncbi:helix-turn-helix transcriptional regulator [Fictibacillus sp. JL2B1089]|uniref:helix-turn-helix transcriptional regulator n=1 Tax=Fictibacillus sp. JL2B1089 TaxID=3399565 RepID=UPI003A84CCA2